MNEKFEKHWQDLKTERDELLVQIHLAKAELKDEWEHLEKKWSSIEVELEKIKDETEDKARELYSALQVIGDELGAAYKRIRERLED